MPGFLGLPASGAARAWLMGTTALLPATGVLVAAATQAAAQQVLTQPLPDARPTPRSVVAGTAAIAQTPALTQVTQTTNRAAIEWEQFNVGRDHTVNFQQPNASSWTLNRVVGPDPSVIAGRITANGGVAVVNQSGILFTGTSQVNVGSLIASAANITNENFMNGRMVFDGAPRPGAFVENQGNITVAERGLGALVGPEVRNSGTIRARLGRVALAGAETYTLDMAGDGLLSIDVTRAVNRTEGGGAALVTNSGTVQAEGGSVLLTAHAASGLVETLVSNTGRIEAPTTGTGAAERTGTVALRAQGGSVQVHAPAPELQSTPGAAAAAAVTGARDSVTARGGAGQRGGSVTVQATGRVTIAAGARVSASGGAGGGTVRIGGAQGAGSGPVARRTTVERGAEVSADATGSGPGGTVSVTSAENTVMLGTLSARGGQQAGSGGQIELGGQARMDVEGRIDVSAPAGTRGTFTLRAERIRVTDGLPEVPERDPPVARNEPSPRQTTVPGQEGDGTIENPDFQWGSEGEGFRPGGPDSLLAAAAPAFAARSTAPAFAASGGPSDFTARTQGNTNEVFVAPSSIEALDGTVRLSADLGIRVVDAVVKPTGDLRLQTLAPAATAGLTGISIEAPITIRNGILTAETLSNIDILRIYTPLEGLSAPVVVSASSPIFSNVIRLNAGGNITNRGEIAAAGTSATIEGAEFRPAVSIVSGGTTRNEGTILGFRDPDRSAGSRAVRLQVGSFENLAGARTEGSSVTVIANNGIDNRGTLLSIGPGGLNDDPLLGVRLTANGGITNGGLIARQSGVRLNAGTLVTNELGGRIGGVEFAGPGDPGATVDVLAGTSILNAGSISATSTAGVRRAINLDAGTFIENSGTIETRPHFGSTVSGDVRLDAGDFILNTASGRILTGATGNDGVVFGRGNVEADAGTFIRNLGTIRGVGGDGESYAVNLSAGTFVENRGVISGLGGAAGTGSVRLDAGTEVRNLAGLEGGVGSVTAEGAGARLVVNAPDVSNAGLLQARGRNSAVENSGTAAGVVLFNNFTSLTNSGTITGDSVQFLGTTGSTLTNAAGGTIGAASSTQASSGTTADVVLFDNFASLTNSGTITGNSVQFRGATGSTLTNAAGGTIDAASSIYAGVGSLTNTGTMEAGSQNAVNHVLLGGTGNDVVTVNPGIFVRAGSSIENNGTMRIQDAASSARAVDLEAGTFIRNTGTIHGVGGVGERYAVDLDAKTYIENTGTISGLGDAASTGSVRLNAGTQVRTLAGTNGIGGSVTAEGAGARLVVTAPDVNNGGLLQARGRNSAVSVTGSVTVQNSGTVEARLGTATALPGDRIRVDVSSGGAREGVPGLVNSGMISSDGTTTVRASAGTVGNSGTITSAGQAAPGEAATLVEADVSVIHSGIISATGQGARVAITASRAIDTSGDVSAASGAVDLTAGSGGLVQGQPWSINQTGGKIEALGATGRVTLFGQQGDVVLGGTVQASGDATARAGGALHINGARWTAGETISFAGGATVRLSGSTFTSQNLVARAGAPGTGAGTLFLDGATFVISDAALFAAGGGISSGAGSSLEPRDAAKWPVALFDTRHDAAALLGIPGFVVADRPGVAPEAQPVQVRQPGADAPGSFGVAGTGPAGALSLNLNAGNSPVFLLLDGGAATGRVVAGRLGVHGAGGSADLSGSLSGQAEGRAAQLGDVTRPIILGAQKAYRFNACVIGIAFCSGEPPPPPPPPEEPRASAPPPNLLTVIEQTGTDAATSETVRTLFIPAPELVRPRRSQGRHTDSDVLLPNTVERDY